MFREGDEKCLRISFLNFIKISRKKSKVLTVIVMCHKLLILARQNLLSIVFTFIRSREFRFLPSLSLPLSLDLNNFSLSLSVLKQIFPLKILAVSLFKSKQQNTLKYVNVGLETRNETKEKKTFLKLLKHTWKNDTWEQKIPNEAKKTHITWEVIWKQLHEEHHEDLKKLLQHRSWIFVILARWF